MYEITETHRESSHDSAAPLGFTHPYRDQLIVPLLSSTGFLSLSLALLRQILHSGDPKQSRGRVSIGPAFTRWTDTWLQMMISVTAGRVNKQLFAN